MSTEKVALKLESSLIGPSARSSRVKLFLFFLVTKKIFKAFLTQRILGSEYL